MPQRVAHPVVGQLQQTGDVQPAAVVERREIQRREVVEQSCRVGLQRRGAGQRAGVPREDAGKGRHDRKPQRVAPMARRRVAVVVDEREAALTDPRVDRAARQAEERPQPGETAWVDSRFRHAGEAMRAGTAGKLQQQRLRLVVLVVREQHRGGAGVDRSLGQRFVARAPRRGLDAVRIRGIDGHPPDHERHIERHAQRGAARLPGVGAGGKAVVDVDRDRRARPRRGQRRDGSRAARPSRARRTTPPRRGRARSGVPRGHARPRRRADQLPSSLNLP